jgi:hypothetical protein
MRVNYLAAVTAIVAVSPVAIGCSKNSSSSPSATAGTTSAPAITPVRGKLVSVSDSILTVASANGEVRVALVQPVHVYASQPAQLSRVTEGSFVGVTSVPAPDGAQRATEIHIFPEELRGTGEGSYLMGQQGGGENRARMSNGTVGASRMTNGAASRMTNGAASRMTNGAAGGQSGGKLTVNYNGGSQTITIPSGVTVTAIVPAQTKLAAGEDVVALADEQPDGTLRASRVMLTGSGS